MPNKILQISPYSFDHPGGVEQYARTLQEIFPDEMMTLAGGRDFPILEPVKHCPLPCFWRAGFWKIFDHIQSANTSIIISHIRFAPTSWLAFWLARKRKIPYIHIEHGTGFLVHKNLFIAGMAKFVDYTIGKYIIRHADRVICVSEAGKKWVSATFGRSENIDVIYRGFDFPKVERIPNATPKIGFVGRLTGLKNVGLLIETLVELKDEEWTLEIVGDGEERETLEKLSKSYAIENRVVFHGAKSHDWIMTEFYPGIDIFVNPSLQEGLPTTVIEALGMGCHVIATDVGGTREIVGIELVPPKDKRSLHKNIFDALRGRKKISESHAPFFLRNMQENFHKIFNILSRKKIYFLINSLEGGGAEKVITILAKELSNDWNIFIITLKSTTFYEIPSGIHHISLSKIRWNPLLLVYVPIFIFRFKRVMRKEKLNYGISFLEISNFVHIFARKDAVISFRTSIGLFQGITGSIYKILIRILYPKAKKILVGSSENSFEFAQFLGINKEKIPVVPNPIDLVGIEEKNKLTVENEILAMISGKKVFITTGRLIRSKNHIRILKCFFQLKKVNRDFVYIIVGDGPERIRLEKATDELLLRGNVYFTGQVKDVFPYLKISNYFLYASEVEGFPNVLIEAMASGLPIITSNFHTGAQEIILGTFTQSIGKKGGYPYFGPNGVLLDIEDYEEQFLRIIENLGILRQERKGLERYDIKNITSLIIKQLITHEN